MKIKTRVKSCMPTFGTPKIDFASSDEFQNQTAILITKFENLVEKLCQERINGWLTWPHYVSIHTKHEGVLLFQALTNGKAKTWCWRMVNIIDVAIRETMRGILVYHEFDTFAIDGMQVQRVLVHAVSPLIRDMLREFYVANMLVVPYIPCGMRLGPTLSWPEVYGIRLALAMGTHTRLGQESGLLLLEPGLLIHIASMFYRHLDLLHGV